MSLPSLMLATFGHNPCLPLHADANNACSSSRECCFPPLFPPPQPSVATPWCCSRRSARCTLVQRDGSGENEVASTLSLRCPTRERFQIQPASDVNVSDFFFCSGEGKGESGATGRGGGRFFFSQEGGEGFSPRRGRGAVGQEGVSREF